MEKIFSLRNWLTLPESARHLSVLFGETVSESDVLRLALDRKILLSLRAVNPLVARRCVVRVVSPDTFAQFSDERSKAIPDDKSYNSDERMYSPSETKSLSDGRILEVESGVCFLGGYFEMPLSFGGHAHIENEFQRLVGGPAVARLEHSRIFVGDGTQLYQILERRSGNAVTDSDTPDNELYCAATRIPSDAVLVVQTKSLRDFESYLQRSASGLSTDKRPKENLPPSEAIDPSDLPHELGIANIAFAAVTNGYGDSSATFKNRLVAYLEKEFQLSPEAVSRIATVANPDKAPGRKRRPPE